MTTRVFVSSTCYDLIDLRAEVAEHIRQLGLDPVLSDMPETFAVGSPIDSIHTCLVHVDACDVFVCILSQRYGARLKQYGLENVSATHLEYRRAQGRLPTQPRILFYIRDQLLAAYDAWRGAGRPSSPSIGGWLHRTDDALGLFELIEEHQNLVAAQNRSNWRDSFRDSLQLRRLLTKQLATENAIVLLEKMAENGRLPELAISCSPSNRNKIFVRNLGTVAACDVEIFDKGMSHARLRLAAIEPGFAQWIEFSMQGNLVLIVQWRDSVGRKVEETYYLDADGKASLHARRLVSLRAFHLLGPTDPDPSLSI